MDLKEYPSLLLRKASEDKEIKKLKENIRTEVINTIKRGGCYVDRVISSKDLSLPLYYDSLGHTLLHLSVYYELVDSIEEVMFNIYYFIFIYLYVVISNNSMLLMHMLAFIRWCKNGYM